MTEVSSFFCRKRILATGGEFSFRIQQPDSTVISESSFKEAASSSCGTSSFLSSSNSVPNSKKALKSCRSSVISLDYDSDHSSDTNSKLSPYNDSKIICVQNKNIYDSPSAQSLTKPFNLPEKMSTDLDDAEVFFSAKPEAVFQNKSKTPTYTAAEDNEVDDFYIDDFDIDDINDSDIPNYFDEAPTSSVSQRSCSTVATPIREGGPSKSHWEKKEMTPVSTSKPSKISSPGQH